MKDEHIIIESGKLAPLNIRELWHYRELFWMLAWRNIVGRYKQSFFGVLWALGRPLSTMLAFSVIFGKIARLSGVSGVPYPILVFSGVLIWQYFAGMISGGSGALVGNRGLVTKVYFPRVIIPCSGMVVCLIDFLLAFIAFFGLFLCFCHDVISWRLCFFPVSLIILLPLALGIVLVFSSLNVRYRDFHHVVPFLLQVGLFISPVGFDGNAIPDAWRIWGWFNPMYGIIGFARWSLFGVAIEPLAVLIAGIEALILLVAGFMIFRHQEKRFSDYI